MPAAARAAYSVPFQLDLGLTLGPLQRGPRDPTIRFSADQVWRAARTPEGAGCLHLGVEDHTIRATAWGDGAGWLVGQVPRLLGFDDVPETFRPRPGLLAELHRRHPGLRLGRTEIIFEALLPTILEQKVPGVEAWSAYARLITACITGCPHVPPIIRWDGCRRRISSLTTATIRWYAAGMSTT